MPVNLNWLLDQDDLGLRLVTGTATGIMVEWAHAIELEDPAPWLTGGEIVLTTGLRLPESPFEQRQYVQRLRNAEIAALAFGSGIRFEQIPRPIVIACTQLDLPLIEVPHPTPFVAITKRLAEELALDQCRPLQRTVTFQRLLTRQTLRRGLDGLVGTLASELSANVVVLDENWNAVATSPLARPLARSLSKELSCWPEAAATGGVRRLESESGVLEAHRLRGRTGFRGWLGISLPGEVTPGARLLINQSVSLATLRLDQPGALDEARASLGAAILALLLEAEPIGSTALPGLRHLGMTPDDDVRILWNQGRDHHELPLSIARLLSWNEIPHAVRADDSGVVILVRDTDLQAALGAIGGVVRTAGTSHPIGISSAMPPTRCAWALAQAQRASRVAERTGSPVLFFDALGLEGILADDAIRARVQALTDHVVAPLLSPSQGSTEDLRTVRAFLNNNGAWDPTARELRIHRHTLRNRIARIQANTNLSMNRAEDRAMLLLALLSRDH